MTTVAEVLDQAADLIESRGHAKKEFEARDGGLCAAGAMRVVVFGHTRITAAGHDAETLYFKARRQLADAVGIGPEPWVADWNDAHTAVEVVAGLRAAARQARDAVRHA